ncbi:MAG: hypothetical protein ACYDEX_11210 [Mobilitalea sp.]
MVKKLIVFVLICSLYLVACKKEADISSIPSESNENIMEEDAIRISESILTDSEINSITNYDSPQIEIVIYDKEPMIIKIDEASIMVSKEIYKITYTTNFDGFLGPIVIYVDTQNGDIYGTNLRY